MPDLPHSKAHAHPFRSQAARPRQVIARHHAEYAELAVTSNFTFLRGASHPDELVDQAAALGYKAIAITDWNSLAGIVRAHVAARETKLPLIVGCRLAFTDVNALSLLVYPTDRESYGRLCRLLTIGKRRAPKGECHLTLADVCAHQQGLLAIALCSRPLADEALETLSQLRDVLDDDRLSLAITRLYGPDDEEQIEKLIDYSNRLNVPLVAVNDVYYHVRERHDLQDVLTCVRHGCTISQAGFRLFPNGERYLKTPDEMARLFADQPQALARTIEIAERAAAFNLDQLRYEYADETCPPGLTPMEYLRELTWQGAADRYPSGVPDKVRRQIEHEFSLIKELNYASYFLTVHDIVRFARGKQILCQGRGAAANSAVCFCLGVTSVDPDRIDVLFERFVSRERNEPPDIDIDFEHERREEVIQYIYEKYGRERAGLTAEVITYRRRSAVRDVGKALGFSLDAVDKIAKHVDTWEKNPFADSESGDVPAQLLALGFNPSDDTVQRFIALVHELIGFPRHLSQHVGGFVITRGPLCELVPIENAAMDNRTVIEWDKDDIEAMGMLKVDVLGLGMLTCIRKALELIERHHGRTLNLATIPPEDPVVYDMICRADTVGVFQIESRAQMTMLPRLKPRCFYDLVIEVAIVRPGPIIGDMVHPYLRRRTGKETVDYPDDVIRVVLGKTLGVPLFQEQVMALAIKAAGFTAGEAEKLRRAITAWTSKGDIANFPSRFVEGMIRNGYKREFAEWCFQRFMGFSQYGFPESHAASFALLVYASAWIKCYYPAVFAAALLNSQPMGFYAPAQIVRDARDHGVEVCPIDVNHSDWDCTIEGGATRQQGNEAKRQSVGRALPADPSRARKEAERAANFSSHDPSEPGTQAASGPDFQFPISNFQSKTEGNFVIGNRNLAIGISSSIDNRQSSIDNLSNLKSQISDSSIGNWQLAIGNSLRLGFRLAKGLRESDARWIETVRERGRFASPLDMHRATGLSKRAMTKLARADAFRSMNLNRREALWEIQQLDDSFLPLLDSLPQKPSAAAIPKTPPALDVGQDYATVGLSLKAHPVSFIRDRLAEAGAMTAAEAKDPQRTPTGKFVTVAGMVLFRQRPGTAKGVMFMTLEDETGRVDLIVRPNVYEKYRDAAVYSQMVLARGKIEREDHVQHVMARTMKSIERMTVELPRQSRDFR